MKKFNLSSFVLKYFVFYFCLENRYDFIRFDLIGLYKVFDKVEKLFGGGKFVCIGLIFIMY